jgi:hypothetical protein
VLNKTVLNKGNPARMSNRRQKPSNQDERLSFPNNSLTSAPPSGQGQGILGGHSGKTIDVF